jgi:hypothetical protein
MAQGQRLADIAPDLVGAVSVRQRKCKTVAHALNGLTWTLDNNGVLTVPILIQYVLH